MSRIATLVVVGLCIGAGTTAHAQAPTSANAQVALTGCTYDSCALRIGNRALRGPMLVRGASGTGDALGYSGDVLVRAVSAVPEAQAEALAGRRLQRRGGVYSAVGSVASLALGVIAYRSPSDKDLRRNLTIGSLLMGGVAFYGGTQIARGNEHFSRAVWLYNRQLPR